MSRYGRMGRSVLKGSKSLGFKDGYYIKITGWGNIYKSHGTGEKFYAYIYDDDIVVWLKLFLEKNRINYISPWYSVDKKVNQLFKDMVNLPPNTLSALVKNIKPREDIKMISEVVKTLKVVAK